MIAISRHLYLGMIVLSKHFYRICIYKNQCAKRNGNSLLEGCVCCERGKVGGGGGCCVSPVGGLVCYITSPYVLMFAGVV